MNAETWHRIETVVDDAADLAPAERERLLDERCAGDPAFRREVERLLDALDAGGDFLDRASWAPPRAFGDPEEEDTGRGDPTRELPPGLRLGAYRILGLLGRGGTGAVYRARRDDEAFQKDVALKIVRGDLGGAVVRRRFERERSLLARLDHPHIARLYDAGTIDDGRPFFIMELVEGEPLDLYCDRHRLGVDGRLELFLQVCRALEHAHRNLIIHRDLKPSNILVTTAGEAKLLDFGLAKLIDGEGPGDLALTAPRQRPMTPLYASPEQMSGQALTTATDIYGLGLLLFRLLTGRLPYPENAELDLPRWITEVEPPMPSAVAARTARPLPGLTGRALAGVLAGDLDAIVLKALRKEPEKRYGSVGELVEDLRRHERDQPILARRGTRRYRLGKFLRRHRLSLAAIAVVFLLILGFAVAMARQVRLTETARDQARGERDQAVLVGDFLVDMFEVSHPETGFGTALTSRQLIDLAAEQLDRKTAGQPVLHARLLNTMGRLYLHLGEQDRAREFLAQSRRVRGEEQGHDHPDTLASDLDLARLAFDTGDYEESERLAREVLARAENGGKSPLLAADSVLLVGKARQLAGNLAEAVAHYRTALALYERHLPANDRRRAAATLHLLGQGLTILGELDEAETSLNSALERTARRLGDEHPVTASVMVSLCDLYLRRARFSESESTVRRAVEIYRRFLPDGHPMVLEALSYLGASLGALGKTEESVKVRRELLAGAERLYAGDHPNHAIALNELAVALTAAGKPKEAVTLHQRSLAMSRRLFGEHHPSIVQSHFSLALALIGDGQPGEAESVLLQAIELFDDVPQVRDRPESGLYFTELAHLLTRRGAAAQAEPLARSGHQTLRSGYSASHPRVLRAATVHAAALSALGRIEEAEEVLAAALAATEETDASHRDTAAAMELLDEVRGRLAASRADRDT